MFKGRVCIPSCDHSNEKIPIHASFSCPDFIRGVPETEHWNVIIKQGFELEKKDKCDSKIWEDGDKQVICVSHSVMSESS